MGHIWATVVQCFTNTILVNLNKNGPNFLFSAQISGFEALHSLNLKDFNTGGRAKMEDNTSKQEPKVRWTRVLKPTFKPKAKGTNARWTILLK